MNPDREPVAGEMKEEVVFHVHFSSSNSGPFHLLNSVTHSPSSLENRTKPDSVSVPPPHAFVALPWLCRISSLL